jgi:hypothetical protein
MSVRGGNSLVSRGGSVPAQNIPHHLRLIPVEEADAEQKVTERAQIAGKAVPLQRERIRPYDFGAFWSGSSKDEFADRVADGAGRSAGIVPDLITKTVGFFAARAGEHLFFS